MPGWLSITALVKLASEVFGWLRGEQKKKTREWEAGRDAAENAQLRKTREVEDAMDAVGSASSADVERLLGNGGFGGQTPRNRKPKS